MSMKTTFKRRQNLTQRLLSPLLHYISHKPLFWLLAYDNPGSPPPILPACCIFAFSSLCLPPTLLIHRNSFAFSLQISEQETYLRNSDVRTERGGRALAKPRHCNWNNFSAMNFKLHYQLSFRSFCPIRTLKRNRLDIPYYSRQNLEGEKCLFCYYLS